MEMEKGDWLCKKKGVRRQKRAGVQKNKCLTGCLCATASAAQCCNLLRRDEKESNCDIGLRLGTAPAHVTAQ